jgi:hypothetical protein
MTREEDICHAKNALHLDRDRICGGLYIDRNGAAIKLLLLALQRACLVLVCRRDDPLAPARLAHVSAPGPVGPDPMRGRELLLQPIPIGFFAAHARRMIVESDLVERGPIGASSGGYTPFLCPAPYRLAVAWRPAQRRTSLTAVSRRP